MEMTDKEIYRNWKESKNPAAQVKILADINGCKPSEITAIIRKVEAAQNQTKPVPAAPAPEEPANPALSADDLDKRLIELYNSGAAYKEMTAALSVPIGVVKYHLKKLSASGEITCCRKKKPGKPASAEPNRERTENVPVTIPADDMVQWIEALRACTDMVEGGAKITHICANDGAQAEVGFTANGKNYLIKLEVQE